MSVKYLWLKLVLLGKRFMLQPDWKFSTLQQEKRGSIIVAEAYTDCGLRQWFTGLIGLLNWEACIVHKYMIISPGKRVCAVTNIKIK